jgi:hypothetical protein
VVDDGTDGTEEVVEEYKKKGTVVSNTIIDRKIDQKGANAFKPELYNRVKGICKLV